MGCPKSKRAQSETPMPTVTQMKSHDLGEQYLQNIPPTTKDLYLGHRKKSCNSIRRQTAQVEKEDRQMAF